MKQGTLIRWVACVAVLAAGIVMVGCEDASNHSITVTPAASSLDVTEGSQNAVVLTASNGPSNTVARTNELLYPLEWSVTEPSLGNISSSGGNSAVYTRTGARGSNTIIVRDQGDGEGVAVVTQY